ncbi:Holliday junction resolvase YqgF [Chlorobaculum parvum NCIB 8327]|uniref:Putative pre-16S rRNA nuclease n=1 Tax=Chlorobaculum parvum (strain DSM 263 / NCIMB 8327) TaxID=517417 RepID=B3QLE1_CHLP8|nr:Holliday junction resolvase RuvX [Chlorobaculum parvum]ACF12379.1 Holliday junction resolvase YqgF [Chlorobaculum parvum NCIB 8327]
MPHSHKRIIGIDFGTKRIGVAKSDPLGMFAQPVGTFDMEGLLGALSKIRNEEGIERIVVGYPLSDKGEENRMTSVVDRFAEELRVALPEVPVETIDEYRSSRSAMKLLAGSGASRKKRNEKGRLDTAAACLILQSWLDSRA